ncbi:MAG TPA: hypothetical protein VKM72_30815 [Thermoanaerobaculia bacterium]|nr:hypothetical protein [Thermoanaerobaculia bacterium]
MTVTEEKPASSEEPVFKGAEPKGTNGNTDASSSMPPKPSTERPFSIETAPWTPPLKIAPQVELAPESSPEVPTISIGEIMDVTARASQCHGAKPVSELHLPPLPRQDMKSSLSGKEIVCRVDVTTTGEAIADCGRGSAEVPPLLIREAKRIVEETPWVPAKDEDAKVCQGQVTVRFPWS